MDTLRKHLLLFLFSLLSTCVLAQRTVDRAISILEEGNYPLACVVLQENIENDPDDQDSRLLLGILTEHLGKRDEAVAILEKGIQGSESDYPFHMTIGEIRFSQAESLEKANPDLLGNWEDYAQKKVSYLQKAEHAYLMARNHYPYEPDPIENLAEIFHIQGKEKEATQAWDDLIEMYPDRANYKISYSRYLLQIEQQNEAREILWKAIEQSPYQADAYEIIAQIELSEGREEDSRLHMRKYQFYSWKPSFIDLEFNEDLYKKALNCMSAQLTTKEKEVTINSIIQNPSEEHTKLIGVLLWNNCLHSHLRNELINQLKKEENSGAYILVKLLEETSHPDLFIKLSKEVLGLSIPGKTDLLLDLIDKYKSMDPMNYYTILSQNKDIRFIPTLTNILQPEYVSDHYFPFQSQKQYNNNSSNYTKKLHIRGSALFTLSTYTIDCVDEILYESLNNPELFHHACAALYYRTKNLNYLKPLIKSTKKGFSDLQIADFLLKLGEEKSINIANKIIDNYERNR